LCIIPILGRDEMPTESNSDQGPIRTILSIVTLLLVVFVTWYMASIQQSVDAASVDRKEQSAKIAEVGKSQVRVEEKLKGFLSAQEKLIEEIKRHHRTPARIAHPPE
jgi:cell division protein FtsB